MRALVYAHARTVHQDEHLVTGMTQQFRRLSMRSLLGP